MRARNTTARRPTTEERMAICERRNEFTIDGKPAWITGYPMDFGFVNAGGGVKVEFAWETIVFVVEKRGGKFRSS